MLLSPVTRILGSGFTYDANGNITATATQGFTYDTANRMSATGSWSYRYDPWNRKVWSSGCLHLYGPNGQLIGDFQIWDATAPEEDHLHGTEYVYFAGHRLTIAYDGAASATATDRLGSGRVSASTVGYYYPYGESKHWSAPMFATYPRRAYEDSNLYYAMNRWYSSQIGRFTTPDPYRASASLANPQSWNRYAYVENDPVNFNDPAGLYKCPPGSQDWCVDVTDDLPFVDQVVSNIYATAFESQMQSWNPGANHMSAGLAAIQSASTASAGANKPRPVGYALTRQLVSKLDCARLLGFDSGAAAVEALDKAQIVYRDLGTIRVENVEGGTTILPEPTPARTGRGRIELSTQFNWLFPDSVSVINTTTGQRETLDYQGRVNAALGSSLTGPEVVALVLIHEFRHLRGAPLESNFVEFNTEILNNCIK